MARRKKSTFKAPRLPFNWKWKHILLGYLVICVIGALFHGPTEAPVADTEESPTIVQQEEIDLSEDPEEAEAPDEPEEKSPQAEIQPATQTEPAADKAPTAEAVEKEPQQPAAAEQSQPAEVSKPVEQTVQAAPQVTPEQAFRESLYQYTYVGSSESDKYHYPRCRAADKINEGNLVHFETTGEAAAAGYAPCGICKPPK